MLNLKENLNHSLIQWLHNDLSLFKNSQRWLIIFVNQPIFLPDDSRSDYQKDFFKKLQLIFKEYNVNIVFTSGGDYYRRTMPIYDGIIYPFKNYGSDNKLKECKEISQCDSSFIMEAQAPIYILESFTESSRENNFLKTSFKITFFKI